MRSSLRTFGPVLIAENIGESSATFRPFIVPECCVPVVAFSPVGAPYGPPAQKAARIVREFLGHLTAFSSRTFIIPFVFWVMLWTR